MTRARRWVLMAAMVCAGLGWSGQASAQPVDRDQERMRQLVLRIRKSMREIDTLLLTGAQPEKTEKELAANLKRFGNLNIVHSVKTHTPRIG